MFMKVWVHQETTKSAKQLELLSVVNRMLVKSGILQPTDYQKHQPGLSIVNMHVRKFLEGIAFPTER